MRVVRIGGPQGRVEDLPSLRAPEAGEFLWVDARGPLQDPSLQAALDIPDRFLPYLTERPQNPCHGISPKGVLAVLVFVDRDFPPLRPIPLSIVLGEGWLVTVTWGEQKAVEEAWSERRRLLGLGVDMVLLALLAPLFDTYGEIVDGLVHRGDVIDALALKGAPRLYEDIHRLRRHAAALRKLIQPQLDAVAFLRDHHLNVARQGGEPYLDDLLQRLQRISREIEAIRESMLAVVQSYASVVSNQMNRVMKLLTVVSVVFLPATLIASIYGMNFKIPEYHWTFGYWYSLGLMVTISTCILWYMHAKGWFR